MILPCLLVNPSYLYTVEPCLKRTLLGPPLCVRITKVSAFLGVSSILPVGIVMCTPSDVQVCHQRLSSAYDLLLIFLCSLIQTLTLTLTPPPNNALLANMETCECTLGRWVTTRSHFWTFPLAYKVEKDQHDEWQCQSRVHKNGD